MKDEMFDELLESVKEASAIRRGGARPARVFEYPDPKVRSIRDRTGLSQDKFAMLIGVNPATLRNWEQGRRRPTGPARALLRILDADTERAILALHPKKN
jgi:putative transcriptional regulator